MMDKKYSEMTKPELIEQEEWRTFSVRTNEMRESQRVFMLKFNDIDLLLSNANTEVEYYFKRQNDFKTVDEFKCFLKEKIQLYVNSYPPPSEPGVRPIIDKKEILYWIQFEEDYKKIVFFGDLKKENKKLKPIKKETLFSRFKKFVSKW